MTGLLTGLWVLPPKTTPDSLHRWDIPPPSPVISRLAQSSPSLRPFACKAELQTGSGKLLERKWEAAGKASKGHVILHPTHEVVFTTNQTESLWQTSMTEQGKMALVLFEDSPVQQNHRQKALELCLFWAVCINEA